MIITKVEGRLGNQLFQYAFSFSIAKKRNCDYYFNVDSFYKFVVLDYFKLRKFESLRLFYARCLYFIAKKKQAKFISIDEYNPEDNLLNFEDKNVLYNGYFQSLFFFKDFESEVKELFRIKKKYKNQFKVKYKECFENNKTVVIHVRRTDFVNFGNDELGGKDLSLPISYFQKCIDELEMIPDLKFYLISDDEEFVKQSFQFKKSFTFERNSEIIDFQLLLNADYLVISNSTFAWWATYLNAKKTKVYAPMYWLGFRVKKEFPDKVTMGLNWSFVEVD